jgi:valyl-tRNA synthetase
MQATETLAKVYAPEKFEPEIRARWESSGAYHADPRVTTQDAKPPYCILIPPPNVTAALHLGHAFTTTLQDILIRYHRMRGFNTLWMPGTDHAGIATQAVVEKRLLQEGRKRTDFTRDQFIALVQAWKDEYEATITEQLKAMGCSCDWQRQRFTMDPVCAKAVREAFFRLFKMGLIYRGKRLVNWDPVTLTALADDEVEMEEVQGKMYYLRYPLEGDIGHVTVATTRPETMLGDVAVAMNPKDPRAKDLVGRKARLPIVGRVIPIIEDDYVVLPRSMGGDEKDPKSEIATGFLKVTPAHDVNDYEIGRRHNLDVINVLAPDASISKDYGWLDWEQCNQKEIAPLLGQSREAAREKVVKWFKDHGLLEEMRDYAHSVGHSYRSHVPIEPYLSDQWYVKVTDDRMAGEALRAMTDAQFDGAKPTRETDPLAPGSAGVSVENMRPLQLSPPAEPGAHGEKGDSELTFFPSRYARTFQQWHTPGNLRDWCISRQLWWGHRIPVWRRQMTIERGDSAEAGEFGAYGLDHLVRGEYEHGVIRVHDESGNQVDPHEVLRRDKVKDRTFDVFVCYDGFYAHDAERLEDGLFTQDPDVLDTWFSSGLWPLSTMGWPEPEAFPEEIPEGSDLLRAFNPSSVLCTAREIITLWVSRMVMFNRCLTADDPDPARRNRLPFKHVYIHPVIQDGHGQKMSKSLGNGVDPRDIITTHGADALRFTLAQLATSTQDVRMPVDTICPHCGDTFHPAEITTSSGHRVASPEQICPKCRRKMVTAYGIASGKVKATAEAPLALNSSSRFDFGRNFCNKLWNAARFALSNLGASSRAEMKVPTVHGVGFEAPSLETLTLPDRWILARLHRTLHKIEDALDEYQFNIYAEAMYDFIWRDFCDWYLEAIKPTVKQNAAQQQVLRTVLNATLRLLHPICPFVTEALYPSVAASGFAGLPGLKLGESELLAAAPWPDIACSIDDKQAHDRFARIQSLVESIRTLRGEHRVPDRARIALHARARTMSLIDEAPEVVRSLAGLSSVDPVPATRPREAVPFTFEGEDLQLVGLVQEVDEISRAAKLASDVAALEKSIATLDGRLANKGYVEKAPPEKVRETRDLLEQARRDLELKKKAMESRAD